MGLNFYGVLLLESCQPVQANVAPRSNVVIPDSSFKDAFGFQRVIIHLAPPEFTNYYTARYSFDAVRVLRKIGICYGL